DGDAGENIEREEERRHPPVEADVRGVQRRADDADERRQREENDVDPVELAGWCVHESSRKAGSITRLAWIVFNESSEGRRAAPWRPSRRRRNRRRRDASLRYRDRW